MIGPNRTKPQRTGGKTVAKSKCRPRTRNENKTNAFLKNPSQRDLLRLEDWLVQLQD